MPGELIAGNKYYIGTEMITSDKPALGGHMREVTISIDFVEKVEQ